MEMDFRRDGDLKDSVTVIDAAEFKEDAHDQDWARLRQLAVQHVATLEANERDATNLPR